MTLLRQCLGDTCCRMSTHTFGGAGTTGGEGAPGPATGGTHGTASKSGSRLGPGRSRRRARSGGRDGASPMALRARPRRIAVARRSRSGATWPERDRLGLAGGHRRAGGFVLQSIVNSENPADFEAVSRGCASRAARLPRVP